MVISICIFKLKSNNKNISNSEDNDDEIEVYLPKDKEQKPKNELDKLIVGIDFGSSYSGFSFSIDKETIETKYEHIQPTILVMEKETRRGYKYGNDADNFMSNGRSNNFIYFDRIKTKLDPKFGKNDQSEILIEANFPQNYKMELKLVITEFLRLFSDDILNNYINLKGKSLTKSDIKWIITVPAIWNDYGKQFMIDCSREAGIYDIGIALEPEAASLTMFKDNIIEQEYKQKGKKFMLIDAGGYTIDITLNEIIDNFGNLKQLSPPSGGAFGSMNINKDLIGLVEEIFGLDKIEQLKKNKFELWKITLDSIEKKKKQIKNDGSDAEEFLIDKRFDEKDNYKYTKGTSYGNVKYDNSYIYVPRDVMKKIILKNVNPIINHIKELFEKFKNVKIDVMVITGGFSNCNILINEIKNNFKNCPHKILSRPETSVMNGAVLYGIEPNKIVSRKAPSTIGISSYHLHKKGTKCKNKIELLSGKVLCSYFDVFKKKGDDIRNNDYIIKSYRPISNLQTVASINLYYSNSLKPLYLDEPGVNHVGEFTININETDRNLNERECTIKMEFGSSITVSAKNVLSGEVITVTSNYYNRND